jgi:hypothetical protein
MSQIGMYLNLKPHMQSWAVYNENGPYTTAHKMGTLAPVQFGGLSYKILGEKGGDVYIIQIVANFENEEFVEGSLKDNLHELPGDLGDGLEISLKSLFLNISEGKNISIVVSSDSLKIISSQ